MLTWEIWSGGKGKEGRGRKGDARREDQEMMVETTGCRGGETGEGPMLAASCLHLVVCPSARLRLCRPSTVGQSATLLLQSCSLPQQKQSTVFEWGSRLQLCQALSPLRSPPGRSSSFGPAERAAAVRVAAAETLVRLAGYTTPAGPGLVQLLSSPAKEVRAVVPTLGARTLKAFVSRNRPGRRLSDSSTSPPNHCNHHIHTLSLATHRPIHRGPGPHCTCCSSVNVCSS